MAPRTHRYASNVALRAPDRGWLIVRGRRGHYTFSDEVRAYDLATGAAFVAASGSALVLDGPQPGVDHARTEKNRSARAYAGRVAREHLRELAFALVTAPAVVRERAYPQALVVPDGVTFEIGSGARPIVDHSLREWRTSNHTTLEWTLAEGGAIVERGTLYYPSSSRAAEDQADSLLHAMEAGLVEGCTPAKLPKSLALGGKVRVSSIDADAGAVDAVMSKLENALLALKPALCP
jgi:hypothetical protein